MKIISQCPRMAELLFTPFNTSIPMPRGKGGWRALQQVEWLEQEHLWALGGRVSLSWSWCCLLNLEEGWFQVHLCIPPFSTPSLLSQPPHPSAVDTLDPQSPPRPQAFPDPFPLPVQEPSASSGWSYCPMRRCCGMGLCRP